MGHFFAAILNNEIVAPRGEQRPAPFLGGRIIGEFFGGNELPQMVFYFQLDCPTGRFWNTFFKFLKRLGFQKASKMEPKSVQNHEKSIQNRSKIDHWRLSAPKVHPKHVPDRFFAFFSIFGSPRASQNGAQIAQHREKCA